VYFGAFNARKDFVAAACAEKFIACDFLCGKLKNVKIAAIGVCSEQGIGAGSNIASNFRHIT
jgi:hypothetical protein